jgi:hypothetical protein
MSIDLDGRPVIAGSQISDVFLSAVLHGIIFNKALVKIVKESPEHNSLIMVLLDHEFVEALLTERLDNHLTTCEFKVAGSLVKVECFHESRFECAVATIADTILLLDILRAVDAGVSSYSRSEKRLLVMIRTEGVSESSELIC